MCHAVINPWSTHVDNSGCFLSLFLLKWQFSCKFRSIYAFSIFDCDDFLTTYIPKSNGKIESRQP